MDNKMIAVIAIFALIIIASFLVFRQRSKVRIKGPLGTGLDVDASNDPLPPTPGVTIEDAKSRGGGLLAEDQTGRGASVKRVDVQTDIGVSSVPPPKDHDPKA